MEILSVWMLLASAMSVLVWLGVDPQQHACLLCCPMTSGDEYRRGGVFFLSRSELSHGHELCRVSDGRAHGDRHA